MGERLDQLNWERLTAHSDSEYGELHGMFKRNVRPAISWSSTEIMAGSPHYEATVTIDFFTGRANKHLYYSNKTFSVIPPEHEDLLPLRDYATKEWSEFANMWRNMNRSEGCFIPTAIQNIGSAVQLNRSLSHSNTPFNIWKQRLIITLAEDEGWSFTHLIGDDQWWRFD